MGQIWDRISRIAKNYLNDTSDMPTAERILHSDDDELRRIIEDLDKPKSNHSQDAKNNQQRQRAQQQNSQHQNSQKQSSQQKPRTSSGAMTLIKAAAILGIQTNASVSDIKSAYKKKVMKFHPDRVGNAPQAEQNQSNKIIVEVNQAYQFFQQLKGF